MSERNLSDKFALKGDWWLVGRKKHKASGDFCFSDRSMFLGLYRSIAEPGRIYSRNLAGERRVLWGETSDNERVSLFHCMEAGKLKDERAEFPSSWAVQTAVIGMHLKSADEPEFASAVLQFDVLGFALLKHLNIKSTTHLSLSPRSFSIKWKKAQTFKSCIRTRNETWAIQSLSLFSGSHSWFRGSIDDVSALRMEPTSPRSVNWFIQRTKKLRTLLALLCGQPVHLTKLTLLDAASNQVDVYLRQGVSSQTNDFYNLMLKLSEMPARLRTIVFNRFYKLGPDMDVVLGLLEAFLFEPSSYGRMDFINLTQALEGFHRLAMPPGRYLRDAQYNKHVRDEMIKQIPRINTGLTAKLKAMLHYGNQYSQRKRFKEIAISIRSDFGEHLIPNVDLFVQRICDTRNAFTHPGAETKGAISETDCHYANRGLALILLLLILRKLGVPPTSISKKLKSSRLYLFFELNRTW